MSIRREMRRAARTAPKLLRDAAGRVVEFVRSQLAGDGGFRGRSGASDLYYTMFGIESLRALGGEIPLDDVAQYLRSFGNGESLDLVHLACLVRSWAALDQDSGSPLARERVLERVECYRTADGGYSQTPEAGVGTAYGAFLAVGLTQDLGVPVENVEGLAASLELLRTDDGAYANGRGLATGLTPATAAAVTLLCELGRPVDSRLGAWLVSRCHPSGGFFALPGAPAPDLLSTATALHALSGLGIDLAQLREPCLDFLDSLWCAKGGFYGQCADDALDCEYTYYGLLALGHLSG